MLRYRRGLLRLWITGSIIWTGGCLWHFAQICHGQYGDIACDTTQFVLPPVGKAVQINDTDLMTYHDFYLKVALWMIGGPVGVLIMFIAAVWVFRGFRTTHLD